MAWRSFISLPSCGLRTCAPARCFLHNRGYYFIPLPTIETHTRLFLHNCKRSPIVVHLPLTAITLWYGAAVLSADDARQGERGMLLVVAGPSGVGKGTLISGLLEHHPRIELSVSCTTRGPRAGEVDGREYDFVTEAEFERMRGDGELLETAVVHGRDHYGTPRMPIEDALAAGRDIVLEIDYQGARSVRAAMPQAVLVFVAPPTIEALKARLSGRNTESPPELARRLRSARTEIANLEMFQYIIVNDRLDEAIDALEAIYLAERQRLRATPWRGLQNRLLADLDAELKPECPPY